MKNFVDISDLPDNLSDNLTSLSLFSGAGGMDIGLEMAGIQTLGCIEIDADCRATLKHNRPDWELFDDGDFLLPLNGKQRMTGDIRAIDPQQVLKRLNKAKGEIDFVVGGAPCQPFSNMGKKLGANDDINGDLFQHYVRFIEGIHPRTFIFENVVGIYQAKHSDVIKYMEDKFKEIGYNTTYSILNAADYGVPQRRERFIMVGVRDTDIPLLPLKTHYKSYDDYINVSNKLPYKIKYQKWVTVQDAFDSLPDDRYRFSDCIKMNLSDIVIKRMGYIKQGENFKVLPMSIRPDCWKSGKHQGQDTFGRLRSDLPSVTIRTAAYNPSKGMYIHPFENRGLDSYELKALQSFPFDWQIKTASGKPTLVSIGKQIGNAVPPLLACAIAKALIYSLKIKEYSSKAIKHPTRYLPETQHQPQPVVHYVR